MNIEPDSPCCRATLNWAGVIGAFLVMALLVSALKHYSAVPGVNTARAQERSKFLNEARQKATEELKSAAWLDREKGVVRLPNDLASALAVKQWQDPAKARADLIERASKAFLVPPPPPEPKSEFE